MVKAECYGQSGIKPIKAILQGGCNYLAVATLEEALDIRKKITDIPILCMGVVSSQYIETCIQNNVTITINSLEYLYSVIEQDCEQLKVHLKINTGMNRLGINNNEDVIKVVNLIKKYNKQIEEFKNILKNIDLKQIPIVHISASEALTNYEMPDFVNGCRLGIIMYGFTDKDFLEMQSTATLISQVIQIHNLKAGETVGYNAGFKAKKDTKIAVVSIGYADGIIRKNTGRYVYINDKKYKIIGNICMDMLFVEVDDNVKLYDKVYILKDNKHIQEVAKYLDTIPYEVMCLIGKRVSRIYKN